MIYLNVTDSSPITFQLLSRFTSPFSLSQLQSSQVIYVHLVLAAGHFGTTIGQNCVFVKSVPLPSHPCVEAAHQDSWLKVNVSPASREQLLCHRHHSCLYIAGNTNSSFSLCRIKANSAAVALALSQSHNPQCDCKHQRCRLCVLSPAAA